MGAFWRRWLAWSAFGAGLALALAHTEGFGAELGPRQGLALVLSIAPLVGAQLALGSPTALAQVRGWVAQRRTRARHVAVFAWALCYLAGHVLVGAFDPYATAIVVGGLTVVWAVWGHEVRGQARFTWTDGLIWLWLWIPFDLRWTYALWHGLPGLDYAWWAVALTVVAALGWYVFREWPARGYRLTPQGRDLSVAVGATLAFAAIVIPIGLAIDFLRFPPTEVPRVSAVLAGFAGLFLTVALPEEIFFRGILLHGLDHTLRSRWASLALSSVAFGLMHWNNANGLAAQIAYVGLATLAGAFYGWAYRRSGNNLLAPVLTHTLVDLIWRFGFQ